MRIRAIVDGVEKWVDLPKESVEQIRNGKIAETGYEKGEKDDFICHVDSLGFIRSARKGSYSDSFLESQYASGNYYTSEKVAKANARADRLMWKLRRFAVLNGGFPKFGNPRFEIFYSKSSGINVSGCSLACTPFSPCFADEATAHEAIEQFREDLMWYFTEYEPQLYEN